jgi:hypothetical protein
VLEQLQNNQDNDHKYESQNPVSDESLSEMAGTLKHDLSSPETFDIQTIIGESRERVRKTFETGIFFQQRVLTNYYGNTSTQKSS